MRTLTGIQPSGILHLGNYLGAMQPAIAAQDNAGDCYYFIADYHALTSEPDGHKVESKIFDLTADLLAVGLDPKRSVIYQHRWDGEAYRHVGNGLPECRQATQDTRRSICRQYYSLIFDGQRVILTRIDRQIARIFSLTVNPKSRRSSMTDIDTSSSCNVVLKPQHCHV